MILVIKLTFGTKKLLKSTETILKYNIFDAFLTSFCYSRLLIKIKLINAIW